MKAHAWLLKGTAQLLHRYSTGKPNQNHGALIIYHSCKDVQNKLKDWKSFLDTSTKDIKYRNIRKRLGTTAITCKIDDELYFNSIHTHEIYGQEYNMWHVPVVLYHNPSDRDI